MPLEAYKGLLHAAEGSFQGPGTFLRFSLPGVSVILSPPCKGQREKKNRQASKGTITRTQCFHVIGTGASLKCAKGMTLCAGLLQKKGEQWASLRSFGGGSNAADVLPIPVPAA
jgi:hypothetical protein